MRTPKTIILALLGFLSVATACRKEHKEVTGCKDPVAYNYDSTATINSGCKYHVDNVAGEYMVHDTLITFQHDTTRGWYDTAYSTFSIHAIAYGHDSLDFDTLLCIGCSGGYKFIASDFTSFYTRYDYYPVLVSQDDSFSGDTFRYSAGVSPLSVTGGYQRRGAGLKVH